MKKEEIEFKLTALYMEWEYVNEHGTSSTVWTDGRALNFIRKKIKAYKESIEPEEELPGICFHELPRLTNWYYVKDAEKICAGARQTLNICLNDENYKYLKEVHKCIVHSSVIKNAQEWELICRPLEDMLFHVEKFQKAVEEKHCVLLKQYLDAEKMLLAFRKCRAELELEIEGVIPFE